MHRFRPIPRADEVNYRRTSIPEISGPSHAYTTYFQKSCPACGRPLLILVQFLGRRLFCDHCGCRFVADDPQPGGAGGDQPSTLERAEQLLASLASSR